MLKAWGLWAHEAQRPPPDPWRTWLFLGGRGAGKTRAAAEWVRDQVERGLRARFALIGPTLSDVREVMIEGPSGLRAIATRGERPAYFSSRRRLEWPNGAVGFVFSAEDPDSLRGPQFDGAWGDEIAAWPLAEAVLATLEPAMRLGEDPRMVFTTTPRPIPVLRRLLNDPSVVVTRASSSTNAANLAPGFLDAMQARFGATALARQELGGELIDDPEGALWNRAALDAAHTKAPPLEAFERIVIGVDPPVSVGPEADACGIVVVGLLVEDTANRAIVLADCTVQGLAPMDWANAVAAAFQRFQADKIVVEGNQGGELVRTMLVMAAPHAAIKLVHASRAKRARAEPVAALYARGLVTHAQPMPALEDEMCAFGATTKGKSPDRVDALVWALWELMLAQSPAPRLRPL